MNRYVIELPSGYVVGFSSKHLCVQITDSILRAKRFTAKTAQAFIDKYADAGYGLQNKDAEITLAPIDN
jgi:hypothetical protein